jgi:hypothetical protein
VGGLALADTMERFLVEMLDGPPGAAPLGPARGRRISNRRQYLLEPGSGGNELVVSAPVPYELDRERELVGAEAARERDRGRAEE